MRLADSSIVVSAVSARCALGADADGVMAALCRGETGIGEPWPGVGPVARAPHDGPASTTGTALALAVVGDLAPRGAIDPEGLAVVGASTAGDMGTGERAFADHLAGRPLADPGDYLWPQPCHRPTRAVAVATGARGPVLTASTACTSGATAIGIAMDLIRSGRARRAIAFGTDALCLTTTSGFAALGLHSRTACRPFDADRDGMCLGEGAAALLVETAGSARARGAAPLAAVLGFGSAVDAHHLSSPDPEARGAIAAMRQALAAAELAPGALGYVNAHGTGTALNDAMEALALRTVAPSVPVSSTKGATGHTLGAAGALEAVFTVLALRNGVLPPNIGLLRPPDDLGLDLVRTARTAPIRAAMSVNFAFGGHNTAIVFGGAA